MKPMSNIWLSRTNLLLGTILITVLCFGGCSPYGKNSNERAQFPPKATNVQDLGGDWHTFEMDIDGKRHRFLYHRTGYGNTVTESLTEIN